MQRRLKLLLAVALLSLTVVACGDDSNGIIDGDVADGDTSDGDVITGDCGASCLDTCEKIADCEITDLPADELAQLCEIACENPPAALQAIPDAYLGCAGEVSCDDFVACLTAGGQSGFVCDWDNDVDGDLVDGDKTDGDEDGDADADGDVTDGDDDGDADADGDVIDGDDDGDADADGDVVDGDDDGDTDIDGDDDGDIEMEDETPITSCDDPRACQDTPYLCRETDDGPTCDCSAPGDLQTMEVNPASVAFDGDSMFVLDNSYVLTVYDVSDFSNIMQVSANDFSSYLSSSMTLWVTATYVFIADYNGQLCATARDMLGGSNVGLDCVDVANSPTSLRVTGDGAMVISANRNGYVLASYGQESGKMTGWEVIAQNSLGADSQDALVVGDYAYVARGGSDLVVQDISTPTSPTTFAELDLTVGSPWSLTAGGAYAYVGAGSGVSVVYVGDFSAPVDSEIQEVAFIETSDNVYDLVVMDDMLFVSMASYGVIVYDISDPTAPYAIAYYDLDPDYYTKAASSSGGNVSVRGDVFAFCSYGDPNLFLQPYADCFRCGEGYQLWQDNHCHEVVTPQAGELIITEIMPVEVDGGSATEWFEVKNLSDNYLVLDGCSLEDDGTDSATLGSMLIAPQENVVFYGSEERFWYGDYQYDSTEFSLNNDSDDSIKVVCNGQTIAMVSYETDELVEQFSWSLSKAYYNAEDSADFAYWCRDEISQYDGLFYNDQYYDLYGTPGRDNISCPCAVGDDCPNGACIDGVCCDDNSCDGPCEACNLPWAVGTCTLLPSGYYEDCGDVACMACDGLSGDSCQPITADDGPNCEADCSMCDVGSCVARDDNDECDACNVCETGATGECTPQTGDDGYSCETDCSMCDAGSCVARNDNDECTTCYACGTGATGDCAPQTADDGYLCETDCTKCDAGSCVARNDNNECGDCNVCETDSVADCTPQTGDDGYNCETACSMCDAGSCVARNDNDECAACNYCENGAVEACTAQTADDGNMCETPCSACDAGTCVARNDSNECGGGVCNNGDMGVCSCNEGYVGDNCELCDDGYSGYPYCARDAEFVNISAGSFWMGSPNGECPPDYPGTCGEELERNGNENLHEVILSFDFEMMTTEVTQGHYRALTGWIPGHWEECGVDCPAQHLSWYSAVVYANLLSEAHDYEPCYVIENISCRYNDDGTLYDDPTVCFNTNNDGIDAADVSLNGVTIPQQCEGYRLPTEAEWEYAARAGDYTPFYTSTSGDGSFTVAGRDAAIDGVDPGLNPIGWYGANSVVTPYTTDFGYYDAWGCDWIGAGVRCGIQPVATREMNAWGLYDMSGNVDEMVWDWYCDYGYDRKINPSSYDCDGESRINRGGNWLAVAQENRLAYRGDRGPGSDFFGSGFRLVRTLSQQSCADDFCGDSPYLCQDDSPFGATCECLLPEADERLVTQQVGSNTVTFVGNYAYVSGEKYVFVFDVSVPSEPHQVFTLTLNSNGQMTDALLVGDTLYYLEYGGYLHVVDVSSPADPSEIISAGQSIGGAATGISAYGDTLYVVMRYAQSIVRFDITNPPAPQFIDSISLGAGGPSDIEVFGSIAYVINGGASLSIFDISVPDSIVRIADVGACSYTWGIAAAEPYVYLGCGNDGVKAYYIGQLDNPNAADIAYSHSFSADEYIYRPEIRGDYLVIPDADLRLYDISNPATPRFAGYYDLGDWESWMGYPSIVADFDVTQNLAVFANTYSTQVRFQQAATCLACPDGTYLDMSNTCVPGAVDDIYEDNDTFETAVAGPWNARGVLHGEHDDDFFTYVVCAEGTFNFRTEFDSTVHDIDMILYDAGQTAIGHATGNGDVETLSYINTTGAAVTVTVLVGTGNNGGSGPYDMTASVTGCVVEQ